MSQAILTLAAWGLALFICCMIFTRTCTAIRHAAHMRGYSRTPHAVTTIPYTIPWLGHTVPFFTQSQQWLGSISRQVNRGIFAVVLGGRKCHIVMSPSLAKEVLAVQAPVNNHDMVGYFMRNVWDDKGAVAAMDQNVLWGKIHRAVYQLNREPFLSQAGHVVTTNIERETLHLVSSQKRQIQRQQRAAVVVHGPTEFEASFFPLVRHFVADIVLPALFGTGFMQKYPDIAADLFQFDSSFGLFLMGLPSWMPVPGLRESAAARDRVKRAMEDLHDAISGRSGTASGYWNGVEDVSSVMKERVRLWEEATAGGSSCSKEAYIASHAFLLWVTLINANVIVFWLLFHIYQDSSLLAAIREEVSPFIQVEDGGDTVKLNSPDIRTQTPLLQSAFLETMRLYTQSNSFKNVQADFTVTESETDQWPRESGGCLSSGSKACQNSQTVYQLQKGDIICVPFGVHQSDARYWDCPEKFDGRRFLIPGPQAGAAGKTSVDYTRISPWGSGASLCKGQKLSSREVLEVTAAILVCWDVEPAGTTGWVHPGLARAGGTAVPKGDFRARLRRRLP
ncbi:cytochrome P450 [Aspergillus lucknowensis]|uniref:Cytochrome P450 n=1 Tax=Aspergillus lucknowensis TaxID=176173 RepID=A0ABR4M2L6_9EURO